MNKNLKGSQGKGIQRRKGDFPSTLLGSLAGLLIKLP